MNPNPNLPSDPSARIMMLEQKLASTARLIIVLTLAGVVWLGGLTAYVALGKAHLAKAPANAKARVKHPVHPATKPAKAPAAE